MVPWKRYTSVQLTFRSTGTPQVGASAFLRSWKQAVGAVGGGGNVSRFPLAANAHCQVDSAIRLMIFSFEKIYISF